jgi:hypothetical protein
MPNYVIIRSFRTHTNCNAILPPTSIHLHHVNSLLWRDLSTILKLFNNAVSMCIIFSKHLQQLYYLSTNWHGECPNLFPPKAAKKKEHTRISKSIRELPDNHRIFFFFYGHFPLPTTRSVGSNLLFVSRHQYTLLGYMFIAAWKPPYTIAILMMCLFFSF